MSDRKITGYQIVSSFEEAKLIKLVNAAIEEGWQPMGPISLTTYSNEASGDAVLMVQVMVTYE